MLEAIVYMVKTELPTGMAFIPQWSDHAKTELESKLYEEYLKSGEPIGFYDWMAGNGYSITRVKLREMSETDELMHKLKENELKKRELKS